MPSNAHRLRFTSMSFTAITSSTLCVAALFATTACTRPSSTADDTAKAFHLTQDVSPIFSTRPSVTSQAFFLVKLQGAPLFASAEIKNGHAVISAEATKAVEDEQSDILQKIQALSSDVHIVYRYRMILNGFALVAPTELKDKIGAITGVSHVEKAGQFERPVLPSPVSTVSQASPGLRAAIQDRNSVKFIGGEDAHARGIRGQGRRIGIIDTGIDYTHAMFGGAGTEDAFKAINPSQPTSSFPTAKVIGGLDFVGTEYDSAAVDFKRTVPLLDGNPIDEAGHGSHVAGTVAGHGDGVNTYDGVAPDASLYALKVFGAEGSTGDSVVIAAMEYAADPNGDGDASDGLDVVNLSLGSGYGSGHILYSEAIQNLSRGGTVVVCSGGNSGDTPYIVGSPGVAEDALSVAASVDDMEQNWKFRGAKFMLAGQPDVLVEAIEGPISKPLKDSGSVTGPLVPAGIADQDFSPELAAKVAGKIALIDRGVVPFFDKVKRAQAVGAIGVVVANNQPGAPIAMGGGDGTVLAIPAIMITKDLGAQIKAALSQGDVVADLTTPLMIERPELIDTMAGFSSKGPRSIDALLKPEISAPGNQIISAKIGGGAAGVQMSGTSMASPHMAGVMALMKQTHPALSSAELKSLVMSTAKTMVDEKKAMYPIARQGSGRVQVLKALDASVVTLPSAISLGEVSVESRKSLQRQVEVHNISAAPLTLAISLGEATKGLSLRSAPSVSLAPDERKTLDLRFILDVDKTAGEMSGYVRLSVAGANVGEANASEVARIPVLAMASPLSRIEATSLFVRSASAADAQGAAVDLTLKNSGTNAGDAYIFNFLGRDERKDDPTLDPFRTKSCDLAESGYRVLDKDGVPTLQIAAKIYEPLTTWDTCEVSVLIDSDGDHEADQELAGIKQDHLEGLTASTFSSVLLDAKAAQQIRRDYEAAVAAPAPAPGQPVPPKPVLSYLPAIASLSPMQAFEHSTIAIVEVPVADLKLKRNGTLAVRIATSSQTGSAIEPDDFMSRDPKKWKSINVAEGGASYVGMPEKLTLAGGETKLMSFTKGAGSESLWIAYPSGRSIVGGINHDAQSEMMRPKYQPNALP